MLLTLSIAILYMEQKKMSGRQSKIRITTLSDLKKTLSSHTGAEFGLLVRGERKVEMDLDKQVIEQLQKMLQKVGGKYEDNEDY